VKWPAFLTTELIMRFAFAVALVIVVVAAFFALQNSQVIQVSFFLWRFEGPLVLVLLVTFAAGILAGWLAAIPSGWKKSRQLAELKRELRQKEPQGGPQVK
jgi:uncharacterized integral membrane protein